MSRIVKVGLIALAAASMSATVSLAADLDAPAPIIEHKPVIKGGGFYLRGDIGYSLWQDPELSDTVGGGVSQHFNESAGNSLLAGVGVGYTFRKYLRTDLTFDLRKGEDITGSSPCGTCVVAGLPGFTTENTNLSSYTVLANAYISPGEYGGFTPYVGAGVGTTYLDFGQYSSTGNPPPQAPTDVFDGDDGFRFAWALHAGTSYAVNRNLSLDVGYRYLNVADGRVSDITLGGTDFGDVDHDNLKAHEIRVGFRYTFGGGYSSGDSFSAPQPIFK